MAITDQREIAETVFQRTPKREEINEALNQEHARREAAVKSLYRLRALRLARECKKGPIAYPNATRLHAWLRGGACKCGTRVISYPLPFC